MSIVNSFHIRALYRAFSVYLNNCSIFHIYTDLNKIRKCNVFQYKGVVYGYNKVYYVTLQIIEVSICAAHTQIKSQ